MSEKATVPPSVKLPESTPMVTVLVLKVALLVLSETGPSQELSPAMLRSLPPLAGPCRRR